MVVGGFWEFILGLLEEQIFWRHKRSAQMSSTKSSLYPPVEGCLPLLSRGKNLRRDLLIANP